MVVKQISKKSLINILSFVAETKIKKWFKKFQSA